MKKTTTTTALMLLAGAFGCGEADDPTTAADLEGSLGKQIVEAVASVRSLNLSETAIVDSWNWNWGAFDEPDVAAALDRYVRDGFPGIVMECDPDRDGKSERACFPFSPDNVPPEGVLIFQAGSRPGRPHVSIASAVHLYFTPSGDDLDTDHRVYVVQLDREGARWRVGEGYLCCS